MARIGIAQDDVRENRIVDLFNLTRPADRVRHGTDAVLLIDGFEIEFELKSVTKPRGGVSTVRDFGPDHIAKWRRKHWIIAFYDGLELIDCRYGTPDDMAPWIANTWEYIRRDFELAALIPAFIDLDTMKRVMGDKESYTYKDARLLHKHQFTAAKYRSMMDLKGGYSQERMLDIMKERVKYVMERGSTLNNRHIPFSFFEKWPKITQDHVLTLQERVRSWLKSKPVEEIARGDSP
jgi:hypothetical protein